MDIRRLVGANVRRFRRAAGMTQEQLAERAGLGQQHISDLERGRKNPTVVTLFKLAQALGVTPVDLITPDEEAAAK